MSIILNTFYSDFFENKVGRKVSEYADGCIMGIRCRASAFWELLSLASAFWELLSFIHISQKYIFWLFSV